MHLYITQLLDVKWKMLDLATIYLVAATISCIYILSCHLDFMSLQIAS